MSWDDVDVVDADRRLLRSRVAWIGQDFPRWPFTARINATLGRPGAAHEEIRLAAAAEFADAGELVASFRTAGTRCWPAISTAARTCPVASGSAWPWPGRTTATLRFSSATSPPRPLTR